VDVRKGFFGAVAYCVAWRRPRMACLQAG